MHAVVGVIGEPAVLRRVTRFQSEQGVAPLGEGLALAPLLAKDLKVVDVGDDGPMGLQYLSDSLMRSLAVASTGGRFVYFETEYFGGAGGQGAAVFEDGKVVFGPAWAQGGVINQALERLGVKAKAGKADAFATVGLDRARTSRDWMAHVGPV